MTKIKKVKIIPERIKEIKALLTPKKLAPTLEDEVQSVPIHARRPLVKLHPSATLQASALEEAAQDNPAPLPAEAPVEEERVPSRGTEHLYAAANAPASQHGYQGTTQLRNLEEQRSHESLNRDSSRSQAIMRGSSLDSDSRSINPHTVHEEHNHSNSYQQQEYRAGELDSPDRKRKRTDSL